MGLYEKPQCLPYAAKCLLLSSLFVSELEYVLFIWVPSMSPVILNTMTGCFIRNPYRAVVQLKTVDAQLAFASSDPSSGISFRRASSGWIFGVEDHSEPWRNTDACEDPSNTAVHETKVPKPHKGRTKGYLGRQSISEDTYICKSDY